MLWDLQMFQLLIFQLIGYSCSMILGNLCYVCTYELYHEFNNITLRSVEMWRIIWLLLRHKFDNLLQIVYIFVVTSIAALGSQKLWETIFENSDFWKVFVVTVILLLLKSYRSEDAYKKFICNSGLDCGSFMAYSFYHGYIKYVVPSTSDVSSKGLVERMTDYEAKHEVSFPIKKLFILQPKSMFIPPTLKTDRLQSAENLEEVKLNVGGVVNRSYQLSVYKINGPNWYVNVQMASPLLTYFEECKRSQLLERYRPDVAQSFRRHLEYLIRNDLGCKGLVEVIYYDDLDEHGDRIDVGVTMKEYIEESLRKKDSNGCT